MVGPNERNVLRILEKHGALLRNSHFVFGSTWMHGSDYVNKDALYPHEGDVQDLCDAMGDPFENDEIDTVVGPALGGIVLAYLTARRLRDSPSRWKPGVSLLTPHGIPVYSVFAEKDTDGGFHFTRQYDKYVARKRVLVVDDVLSTGGSAQKVIDLVRATGGTVVGLSVICNRGSVTAADAGMPPKLHALLKLPLPMYTEDDCPLCKQGVEINTTVGRGSEYLARKAALAT